MFSINAEKSSKLVLTRNILFLQQQMDLGPDGLQVYLEQEPLVANLQ